MSGTGGERGSVRRAANAAEAAGYAHPLVAPERASVQTCTASSVTRASDRSGERAVDAQTGPPFDGWVELEPGVWVESGNGVWGAHDWSGVPVRSDADRDLGEPPAGWHEQRGGWLDEVMAPELGPVSWFEEMPPSSRLMAELESLPGEVVETEYDDLELVAHWARLEAHCAARKRGAAARLARRELMAGGLANLGHLGVKVAQPNIAGDELALRLGIGKRAAVRLMTSGRAMTGVAIPTAEALEAGEIDAVKADIIALGIEDLTPDEALEVQERVLAKAPFVPAGSVRRELAVARAKVLPAHFEERCQAAAQQRRVDRPRVLPDGMASLYAIMPAVEANQVYRAVDAAARSAKAGGDPRTLDQLRADALGLMGAAAIDSGWIGSPPHSCAATSDTEPGGPVVSTARPSDSGAGRIEGASTCADIDQPTTGSVDTTRRGTSDVLPPDDRGQGEGSAQSRARSSPGGPAVPRHRAATGGREPGKGPADRADLTEALRLPDRSDPTDETPVADRADPTSQIDPIDPIGPMEPDRNEPTEWADPADAAAWSAAVAGVCPAPPPGERMRVGVIGGRSAHVRVVVPLTSLMGGDAAPGADLQGSDMPAHLEGYGPIPASVARALAAGGPWSRMVTDPVDRTVLEVSVDSYEPPARMADLVRAAQPECVGPSCGVSSDSCDLHHRIPWPAGPTSAHNLDPGCRRDHLLLTHAGWSYIQHPDGSRTWTTATNHVYIEHPDGRIVMKRPAPGTHAPTTPADPAGSADTQTPTPIADDDAPPF